MKKNDNFVALEYSLIIFSLNLSRAVAKRSGFSLSLFAHIFSVINSFTGAVAKCPRFYCAVLDLAIFRPF